MKFTNEDLMKAMGLQIGDKIKVKKRCINQPDDYPIYEVQLTVCNHLCLEEQSESENKNVVHLEWLLCDELEYEILPRPKRVGDLKCSIDIICAECPFKMIANCICLEGKTLDEVLNVIEEAAKEDDIFDQEIYDLLKSRLNKEVSKNE